MVSLNPQSREYNGETSVTGNVTFKSLGRLNENSKGTPQQWIDVEFTHNNKEVTTSARIMGKNIDTIGDLKAGDTLFVTLSQYEGDLMIDVLSKSNSGRISVSEAGLGEIFETAAVDAEEPAMKV